MGHLAVVKLGLSEAELDAGDPCDQLVGAEATSRSKRWAWRSNCLAGSRRGACGAPSSTALAPPASTIRTPAVLTTGDDVLLLGLLEMQPVPASALLDDGQTAALDAGCGRGAQSTIWIICTLGHARVT